jgi:starvation-inducible DNA-binding protein
MSVVTKDPLEISLSVVSGAQREKNHQVLQPILTNLIAYSAMLKQLHWNVVGPYFRPIHLQLDEIYEDAQDAVDTIAERLVACGHSPTGLLSKVVSNSELREVPEGFTHDRQVLEYASHGTHELVGLIRSRMAQIEDVDTVTADILHQIVEKLEKHHWMLQAQRM